MFKDCPKRHIFNLGLVILLPFEKIRRYSQERVNPPKALPTSEEENEASKIFLDTLVESLRNMVFVKDARDLKYVRFNLAGEELVGISRDEMIGKNDFEFYPKEQAEGFIAKDREVLKSGKLCVVEEWIQTRHNGRRSSGCLGNPVQWGSRCMPALVMSPPKRHRALKSRD